MKKHVFGRQLNRDTNERKALFKGLVNALVMEESITTTEAKARAIRGQVEKIITKAKNRGVESRRFLQPWLQAEQLEKVMNDLAGRFANRPGGYTRIIKLGERFGDNASMAVIEFVEKKEVVKGSSTSVNATADKEKVETTVKTVQSKAKKEEKPTKQPTKDTKRKEAQEKKNTSKKG